MSFINLISIALSPVLTALSGYATDKVGFTYVYLWMSLLCACLFLLLFFLPSDGNGRLSDFKIKKLFLHTVVLMRNPLYLKSVLVSGFVGSCVFVFYLLTPYIVINDFCLSARYYGTLLSIPFIGKALGTLVTGLIEDHFTPVRLIKISLMICLMGAILGVSIFTYYPSVFVLFSCFAIINMGIPIAKMNLKYQAMTAVSLLMGVASGLFGSALSMVRTVATVTVSKQDGEMLNVIMLILVVLSCVFYYALPSSSKNPGQKQ